MYLHLSLECSIFASRFLVFITRAPPPPRPPKVVCGPWWSMAVTVDGYCYAWGSADGGWTGLERPTGLSVVDPGPSNDRYMVVRLMCVFVAIPALPQG